MSDSLNKMSDIVSSFLLELKQTTSQENHTNGEKRLREANEQAKMAQEKYDKIKNEYDKACCCIRPLLSKTILEKAKFSKEAYHSVVDGIKVRQPRFTEEVSHQKTDSSKSFPFDLEERYSSSTEKPSDEATGTFHSVE